MNRGEFLNRCQKCAVLPEREQNIKINVPDEILVLIGEIACYPVGYELTFDKNGKPQHTAILHDLQSKTIYREDLGRVKEYENK